MSLVLIAVLVMFAGCRKDKDFDEDMLVGTWRCSDGFSYRFDESGSGRCYDSDNKGSDFSWSLSDDELTIKYELQGKISKPSTEIRCSIWKEGLYDISLSNSYSDSPNNSLLKSNSSTQ